VSARTGRRIAVAAACLALLTGCAGERPGYDDATVESYLARSQATTFDSTAKVGAARCPSSLELREGMRFTCTLEVSGARLPYRVRLTHVHDARMTVRAVPDGVIVSTAKLRAHLAGTLPKKSSGADVDCGGPFVVAKVGATLPCTLVLGSQEQPVKVTVKDETGRVQIGS
jgi:hypothetical protein